jgi:peptidoglycan/LPS O-acetylase OafA/YrhL
MASGYMGVTLFFTLSGFVLTINYFDDLRRPARRKIVRYAVARVARVYPLYLLILAAVLAKIELQGGSIHGWMEHALALQAWAPHLSTAYAFNGPAWSVSVEFFLYACFPLVVFALARVRSTRALLSIGLIVLAIMTSLVIFFIVTGRSSQPWQSPGSSQRWLYRTPLTRLGDFLMGILAARAYLNLRDKPRVVQMGGALAIVGALVLALLMAWPSLQFSSWSFDLAYVVPSTAIIFGLAVAPASAFGRALSLPVVVLLGEASYALYLCHDQFLGHFGTTDWVTVISPATMLPQILVFAFVLATAIALHKLVEKPARTWIRGLSIRWP